MEFVLFHKFDAERVMVGLIIHHTDRIFDPLVKGEYPDYYQRDNPTNRQEF